MSRYYVVAGELDPTVARELMHLSIRQNAHLMINTPTRARTPRPKAHGHSLVKRMVIHMCEHALIRMVMH